MALGSRPLLACSYIYQSLFKCKILARCFSYANLMVVEIRKNKPPAKTDMLTLILQCLYQPLVSVSGGQSNTSVVVSTLFALTLMVEQDPGNRTLCR